MASELDDALRAAAAAAAAATATSAKKGLVAVSPTNAKRNAKKRVRRAVAGKTHGKDEKDEKEEEDPVERLAAFRARMFDDVGTDAASMPFASRATAMGEDMVAVKWKPSTPSGREKHEDEAPVPQLTRAKVVVRAQPTEQLVAVASNRKNKKKQKKKSTQTSVVVPEVCVPPSQPSPVSASATRQKKPPAATVVQTNKTAAAVRDDEAVEFSDPSDDEKHAVVDAVASAKALVAAKVAARKASSDFKPTPQREPVGTIARAKTVPAKVTAAAKTTEKKVPEKQAKNTTTTGATKGRSINNGVAAKTKQPPATMTSTTPAPASEDEEDPWDLDALVKNTVKKQAKQQRKLSMSDDAAGGSEADDEDTREFNGKPFREHQMHLFSNLIDEAARERWELVEVGRLVRIFAAQWSHKKKKTARFLRRCCPELVSVDFLEGLNIPLTSKQLLKIFERGSGTSVVVMNKIASAVENGSMSIQDEDVQSFIVDQTQAMPTNREIVEFVLPLLESLSKVKDVGVLLKAICEHWHIDRTASLVQDILLTPIFDDLDGQPDVILEDLPMLEGRLDFPSCMDDEDADENGNLKGLIAGEDSDLGESDADPADAAEDELEEVDSDGEDSHADDEVYEGETDSDEEREARERLSPPKRRRSRYILDEADEDEEESDGEEDDFLVDDADEGEDDSDSSDDSSEDDAPTKPQRKRLRRS